MNKKIYILLNIGFQLIVFFCLLFANTYFNNNVVPDSLLWGDNYPTVDVASLVGIAIIKTLILIMEGGFIVFVVYCLNRSILNDAKMAKRTLEVNTITTALFIVILTWGSFNGYLW